MSFSFLSLQKNVETSSVSASLPDASLDVKAPSADVEPKLDHSDFKLPSISMPKFGLGNVKIPKVDVDAPSVDLPDASVDISVPTVGSGKTLLDVATPSIEVETPSVSASLADASLDVKAPSLETDLKGYRRLVSKRSEKNSGTDLGHHYSHTPIHFFFIESKG